MKNLLVLLSILISTATFAQKTDDGSSHKVVIQFMSSDSLSEQSLLSNLKNLREGWPKAQVEVVFHGGGLNMAMSDKNQHAKELQDFVEKKQIKMVVCENTMRKKKVTKAQLLPFMETVPMGIGEIILKQEAGWSYIKAGF